jgi:hypothetical protein
MLASFDALCLSPPHIANNISDFTKRQRLIGWLLWLLVVYFLVVFWFRDASRLNDNNTAPGTKCPTIFLSKSIPDRATCWLLSIQSQSHYRADSIDTAENPKCFISQTLPMSSAPLVMDDDGEVLQQFKQQCLDYLDNVL